MMNIKVCVGSPYHLKGSYVVIQALKDILKNTMWKIWWNCKPVSVWDIAPKV